MLLTIHWFNPLIWLAYNCRDIEQACDEKVIKTLDRAQRADYSQALLSCSIIRRTIVACPLAFGEVGVKKRVQNVLSYKKPAFWVVIVGIVVIATFALCFLTNPPEGENVKRKLTIEDVVKLSEKGEELVWEDLEEYEYIETGSGLYIREYEIDERFTNNKDGYPDVTLGSYGSSNWNLFELYTIDSQGKIQNICEDSIAVGVKDHSVFLTQTEEGNTDFYTSAWNNVTGRWKPLDGCGTRRRGYIGKNDSEYLTNYPYSVII